MRLAKIRNMVYAVLVEDKTARANDHYLYCKILERTNPELLTAPFIEVFNNTAVPKFESIRRNRAKLQADFPELAADETTEAARIVKENEYREFFKYGRRLD